jgi:hypothetical protein
VIARFQLLEQPHVLDSNDRLVGEGVQQRYLRIGERPNFHSANDDDPDRSALAQQWNS